MSNIMKTIKKQFPTVCLFVAKSKSGKTHLVRYLLTYYCVHDRFFNFGLVLTGSPYNHEYDFLPSKYVRQFNGELLDAYIAHLRQKKDDSRGQPLPPSFLVLDDCLGLIQKTGAWQNLVSTFRHLNITIFITTQYLKASEVSGTFIREQTGVLFAFRTSNVHTIKALYDYFGANVFDKLKDFQERFNECVKVQHQCMLYIDSHNLMSKSKNFLPLAAPAVYKTFEIRF